MRRAIWDTTATCQSETKPVADCSTGMLLQLLPLDIHRGMIPIVETGYVVGRSESCQLRLDDEAASRRHFRIERRGEQFWLTDLDSTNGTLVNDQAVTEVQLSPGDRISVGKHIFKFLKGDAVEVEYYEAIYGMMTQDGLTSAVNKRAFLDILSRETLRSINTGRPLALVMIDIDHFKQINDQFGHLAGDSVLKETVHRMREVLESHVVLARYGGEEFALLIPELHAEQAARVAERCRAVVADQPIVACNKTIPVTISAGVADLLQLSPDSLTPHSDLIARADAQLYEAKNSGRNRVCH